MDATRADSRRRAPLPVALASLVIVIAGLKAAATILVPITLALFLALVLLPLLRWLRRRRLPTWLAILTVIVVAFVAVGAFALVASASVADIRDALPRYVTRVQLLQARVGAWLAAHRIAVPDASITELLDTGRLVGAVGTVVRAAVEIVERALLIFLIVVLLLVESITFPEKARRILASGGTDLGRLERVAEEVFHYLTIKTLVSLATGALMGLLIWALGIDFPLLWGMLAFALNYVPNVGGAISVLPPRRACAPRQRPGTRPPPPGRLSRRPPPPGQHPRAPFPRPEARPLDPRRLPLSHLLGLALGADRTPPLRAAHHGRQDRARAERAAPLDRHPPRHGQRGRAAVPPAACARRARRPGRRRLSAARVALDVGGARLANPPGSGYTWTLRTGEQSCSDNR